VRTPAVDVHTVGAGGGSIARVDPGGALRVGPESAGADPGPACYGRGNLPTVTDAHLLLGRLRPEQFLGGRMRLHRDRALAAFQGLASWYGGDPLAAAAAVVRVANHNMERAIRVVSVERGYDPRDFALVAFGGAGPLHACDLAEALRIPRVIIPLFPGVLSAFGMVAADVARDFSEAVLEPVPEGAEEQERLACALAERFAALEARARQEMAAEAAGASSWRAHLALDLRYQGQSYELTVPVTEPHPSAFAPAFHAAHGQRYGHAAPGRPLEVVTLRLKLSAPGPELDPAAPPAAEGPARRA
jgi:N-methylhydantoinase A